MGRGGRREIDGIHKVGHSFIYFNININILILVVCFIEDTRIFKLAPIFQDVLL